MPRGMKKGDPNPCAGIPRSFHRKIQKQKNWESYATKHSNKTASGYGAFMRDKIAPAWRKLSEKEKLSYIGKKWQEGGSLRSKKSKGITKKKSSKSKKKSSKSKRKSVTETRIPRGNASSTWFKNNCGDLSYDALKEKKKTYANKAFAEEHCPDEVSDFDKYVKARNKRFRKGTLKYVKPGGSYGDITLGGCGCALCRNKLGGCACSKGMGQCSKYVW